MPSFPSAALPNGVAEERLRYLRDFVLRLLPIWERQIETLRKHPVAEIARRAALAHVALGRLGQLVDRFANPRDAERGIKTVLALSGALLEVDELMHQLEMARENPGGQNATP